jgi:hypothetical protein
VNGYCDGYDVQYIVAVDKRTGERAWKKDRPPIDRDNGTFRKSFCTPLVIRAEGRDQVVIPSAMWFVSYDPMTGDELWRIKHGDGFSLVPRPVFAKGMVYLCTGFGRPELWAVHVNGRGDVTDTHVAWKQMRQIPKKPSPLLIGDEIYVVSDIGVVSCLDAATGEAHWQERGDGNYTASPVFAAGRIYLFGEEGLTTVLAPGTTFRKLAENRIEGRIMASPAIVDDALLLRTDTHLYRIQQLAAAAPTGG